jgi:hypothetical protein
MFETLDERMKHDAKAESTNRDRVVKWVVISAVSLAVFGGLIIAVRFLG